MRLEAGAGGPARLGPVVVEADAGWRGGDIATLIDARAEPGDGACGLDLGDGESAGRIYKSVRRDARPEAAAHRGEPIQFLRAVEGRGRRRDIADRGIAECAGAHEGR